MRSRTWAWWQILLGALLLAGLLHSTAGVVTVAAVLCLYAWHRRSYAPAHRRIRARILGEFLALTPQQFGAAVADVLRAHGYRDLRPARGPGASGVDLWCRDRHGHLVAVQCRRYTPGTKVSSQAVRTFLGILSLHTGVDRGMIATTSEFSAPPVRIAHRHGLTLVDGRALVGLAESAREDRGPGRHSAPARSGPE
jgi:restriction system protein